MSDTCTLTLETNVTKEDREAIVSGLVAYNQSQVGIRDSQDLAIVLRNSEGEVVGGVLGASFYGWLHIDILWVHESLRGSGYGQKLLGMAEAEGRERGCGNIYLDTFSFQALPFYKKSGYRVYGELPDFPEGGTRYSLTKALAAPQV